MKITSENLPAVLRRFYNFDDGVVEGLSLSFGKTEKCCAIDIQCQDRESRSGWAKVTLDIFEVAEFRLLYGRTTFEVLSGGVQIGWRDRRVIVVLDAYPDDGDDLPDLSTNSAFVAGAECNLTVTEC